MDLVVETLHGIKDPFFSCFRSKTWSLAIDFVDEMDIEEASWQIRREQMEKVVFFDFSPILFDTRLEAYPNEWKFIG